MAQLKPHYATQEDLEETLREIIGTENESMSKLNMQIHIDSAEICGVIDGKN